MNEKLKAVREYLKYYPGDKTAKENELRIKYEEELGISEYYPNAKMSGERCILSSEFEVSLYYDLTNHGTKYKATGETPLLIWHMPCGRLQFVDAAYWEAVDEDWRELLKKLEAYNPVDYDRINETYVYEAENAKKLLRDYENIKNDFIEKAGKKAKALSVEKKKKQIEQLQREIEEMENE